MYLNVARSPEQNKSFTFHVHTVNVNPNDLHPSQSDINGGAGSWDEGGAGYVKEAIKTNWNERSLQHVEKMLSHHHRANMKNESGRARTN